MKISKSQTDKAVLISGATDYFGLHFTYDEEFASLEEVKTCEFFKNRKTVKVDLVDGYCAVPNEILRDKNPFEMRIVSGNTVGTPWVAVAITEGGIIINDDEPEELAPMGTAYVKTLTGENNISMIRDNDGAFEYSKDGQNWKTVNYSTNNGNSENVESPVISDEQINERIESYLSDNDYAKNTDVDNKIRNAISDIDINSAVTEVTKIDKVRFYDTSEFLEDTFEIIPTSESFVGSGNFLKLKGAGTVGAETPLIEETTISLHGVDIQLNEDGTVTLNGTSTATFYIYTNITDEFRSDIIGQNVKISFAKSDNTALKFASGLAFNDATYGYNLTQTGSYTGLVTSELLSGCSRLEITANTTFDNLTASVMLEIGNDRGFLSEYVKSDCEVINAGKEYAIAEYPFVGVVGEHTVKYYTQTDTGAEEIVAIKESNPLYGKKITCIGDSLCYGQGFAGGYCTILSELEKDAIFVNKGVGGSQISSNHANGGSWWIVNQLSGVAEDTDYIICEGYVNDYLTDCELGEISDGYEAELDTTKFYGGMESLCKKLANDYTSKRFGFIITHSHYSAESTYENDLYIKAIKQCCDKWGVPYLDLSAIIAPLVPIYKNTYYTDGLHYNEAGYRRITSTIREWIKTL